MNTIRTYDDNVFADVNVGIDDSRVDNGALADENVVADLEGEKGHSEVKLKKKGC